MADSLGHHCAQMCGQFNCQSPQQIEGSFSASVLLLIIIFIKTLFKVDADSRGADSPVDPQTTLTMFWRNSFSVTGRTDV